jgi:hypothetical protein
MYSYLINKLWKSGDEYLSVWGVIGAALILWLVEVVFILGFFHACKKNNEMYDKAMDAYIEEMKNKRE